MRLRSVDIDDKYSAEAGQVFLTGVQALVRVGLDQRRRDRAHGVNTSFYVTGYRGSPLGGLDSALWRGREQLTAFDVRFQPGVNEDLAATACLGTQQIGFLPGALYEGVSALWYGKGPGVDRSGDALKHGNLAGASEKGGVLVVAGDDHGAKSSTTAHQSEPALAAALIPVLHPSSVQECLDFGLAGLAMSRFSGAWAALKCATDIVESGATVELGAWAAAFVAPEVERPSEGLHIRKGFAPLFDEMRHVRYRLPAAQAFCRVNAIDRVVLAPERPCIGVVAAGKAYNDTMQALRELGLDRAACERFGIGLYKPGLTWPLDPVGARAFAAKYREILIIEEKQALIEGQLAHALGAIPSADRPILSGKHAPDGSFLLPAWGELSPETIALALAARLEALGLADAALQARADEIKTRVQAASSPATITRTPAFCSGCPHSTSTRLPEGSVAMAGIGCHTMAILMPDRPTLPPVQMGGEGANWMGMAPFTSAPHIFQNLGDGTYFHSGLLAVRAAVASGANITYKLLYNDAVAMTGGQPVDGHLSVADVCRQLAAEGVKRIVVLAEDPTRHHEIGGAAEIRHRDDLLPVERALRGCKGVTVLIFDQTCAAEKRRRRKRGLMEDPAKHLVINELVCEGCGDCSVQATCVSIVPVETEFGRKRAIDLVSCNKDYSCAKGFCPSFVTVRGGKPRKRAAEDLPEPVLEALKALPEAPASPRSQTRNILIAGIGGTGVVTTGALLAMAAHLEGRATSTLDLTGLSQKNGAVLSHVKIGPNPASLEGARIGLGEADVLLGCDLVVAAGTEAYAALRQERSVAIVNTHATPTAAFQHAPDMAIDSQALLRRVSLRASVTDVDAGTAAQRWFGDAALANIFLLGLACQQGAIPVSPAALERAIELNGAAVAANKKAFALGRLAAVRPELFSRDEGGAKTPPAALENIIETRAHFLAAYQDKAYADAYRAFVTSVREKERALGLSEDLSVAVAHALFKLMAYKDEYEVARLHLDTAFNARLASRFEGRLKISYNLAPPTLSWNGGKNSAPKKRELGAWIVPLFHALKAMRRLRGTPLDVFGYTRERRMERRLIGEYRARVAKLCDDLSASNYAAAVEIAEAARTIRGYGHVKLASVDAYRKHLETKLLNWDASTKRD
ncbi:MAG: indolepyruvate ferredoxin oxidoreductase family protein [Hyphomonadaceae bacterium]|nr:indolepyruvate ferredoxin oxidoreductase family protein [Hyphomonadaceae bacterium]GIK49485.1 MAG: indolepyruvate ferredoxin oxidoreductase [Alphaproteobacteria bacterium]